MPRSSLRARGPLGRRLLRGTSLTQDKNKLSWGLFLGKNVESLKTECKSSRQWRILWANKNGDPGKIEEVVWTVGSSRFQILKVLNTGVGKPGDLEKREGDLPKEPEDLIFKITRRSLAKTKYLIAKAKREVEGFIRKA